LNSQHNKTGDSTESGIVSSFRKSTPKLDSKDVKLLDTIAQRYTSVVGEKKNIKTLLCCLISKDLPKKYRNSVIISNPSSTGKSYLLNKVLEPFKDDAGTVLDFTDMTEAYVKRSLSDVNGKIIKIEQLESRNEQGQLSFHKLKHLLSEGRLCFGQYDADETDKSKKAKKFEVVGIPIIVTTATEFAIDSETQNRFFMMQLDESEDQTKRIIDHTLNDYQYANDNAKFDEELAKFYKQLAKMARRTEMVLIPFADKMKGKLPHKLEIRRDLSKILNLTCVIAFIHAQNRDRFVTTKPLLSDQWGNTEDSEFYYFIAKPEDFDEAVEIAGDTIKQTLNKSSHRLMAVQSLLRKLFNDKSLLDEQGTIVKEFRGPTGLTDNRIREYLNELVNRGFAWRDDSDKEYKYYPEDQKFKEVDATDLKYTDLEYKDWITEILEDNPTLKFVSLCQDKRGQNEL